MMAQEEAWYRRHAIMLASQLPDRHEDGLIVLRLATRRVVDFLAESEPAPTPSR
jgi:hypothetical protein